MIELREINAKNALSIMRLSKTLSKNERKNVADNSVSIAQGSLSEHSWMRAVAFINPQKETYIGFVMLHIGSSKDDGIDVEGPFLWRLMIATPYQNQGYGKKVLNKIIEILKIEGYHSLTTSVNLGEKSPLDFYKKYGFTEIDETFGDEQGLIYQWK